MTHTEKNHVIKQNLRIQRYIRRKNNQSMMRTTANSPLRIQMGENLSFNFRLCVRICFFGFLFFTSQLTQKLPRLEKNQTTSTELKLITLFRPKKSPRTLIFISSGSLPKNHLLSNSKNPFKPYVILKSTRVFTNHICFPQNYMH